MGTLFCGEDRPVATRMCPSTTLSETVRSAGSHIHCQLAALDDSALTNAVAEWCDRQGLNRLDNPREIVAHQAALNTLLKATLYEQYHHQGRLPAFPDDTHKAFKRAYEETDDPAFEAYVLDDVAKLADSDTLAELRAARHRLLDAEEPAEEVGRLFEAITPQSARRKLGQFRTPPAIASLMAAWLVRDGTETVLDPGMGAGALAAAAYHRKQQLVDQPPLSDIYGVDLNELAVVMAATSLALLNHGEPHNLRVGDFLDVDPDDPVDAIISNPPYSRHHELDEAYKKRVNAQAEREAGGTVSALSPMYAYFYFHAAEFLAPGGRLSFITPSEFLETGYGESLKRFLLTAFDIRAFVLFDRGADSKFEEALTTSLVSFLEAPNGEASESTRIIRVDGDPTKAELLAAIDGDGSGETDWGFINIVPQTDLDPTDKWTDLFDPLDVDTSDLVELSEVATVTRGIATGQNDFFCLTQQEVDDWDIDESYLAPIIRNARSVPGYEYTLSDWKADREAGRQVWVLYHLTDLNVDVPESLQPTETDENRTLAAYSESTTDESADRESTLDEPTANESEGIINYLQYGLSEEVAAHSGYLARNRTPWYIVDRRDPPPIVVTYMSRGGGRFILNETNARTLSNLHGLYLNVEFTEAEQKALLAYLNSEFATEVVRRSGRTYASGMDKIEPNELEGVPVLDPRELDDETTRELAARFDRLREAGREGNVDDAIAAIDASLRQIRTRR